MKNWFLSFYLLHAFTSSAQSGNFTIPYETFKLQNGLTVILHEDHSDPVVAVNLTVHVGSAREKEGRTGFAHLFEHLLFLESENLGKGGLDILSSNIGASGANGSTSRDRTNYLQTVPKDALEKMIWAEADKLGWFINTVTVPVLSKEKQVVKNEKRQSYDNNPYGHTMYVHGKAMYPHDHPYNWEVIGSLEDLDNATLEDVKEFYRKWYVPNNVTLVLAGDFDPAQVKVWVHKYFDEIKAGSTIENLEKRPTVLKETVKLYHEDNFAQLPELTLSWPTTEQFHKDAYPISILINYLSEGKNAPLYKVIVEQEQLAASVDIFNYDAEISGETYLQVRAYSDVPLDSVELAIMKGFSNFEEEGISTEDLQRIKAGLEVGFYQKLSSVLGKSETLAEYQYLKNDPGYATEDIQNMLSVTPEDVMRVYLTYFKNKPFVATSFVPKGQLELMLTGSVKAEIVEEEIIDGAEEEFDASIQADYEKTPSLFDRSIEPEYGTKINFVLPIIHQSKLSNQINLISIENNEVPLIEFEIIIDGGQRMEKVGGSASILSDMLLSGTATKTAAELEMAIEQLGSSIEITATKEAFSIVGTTLAKNFKPTIDLLEEILLQPRWDVEEFELIKQGAKTNLVQQKASANAQASIHFNQLIYGTEHIMAKNTLGTTESIENVSIQDLQELYKNALSPYNAYFNVVGNINHEQLKTSLTQLTTNWKGVKQIVPEQISNSVVADADLYFYNFPEAKQSIIRVGAKSMSAKDKNYYAGTIANYILGGGGFASRLTQELREAKGFTYGVNSGFNGRKDWGSFEIYTSVRSNATAESISIIEQILKEYPSTFSTEDLEATKSYLIKSQARNFETSYAKLSVLERIGYYGYGKDFLAKRQKMVEKMTIAKIQKIAKKYMNPSKMTWVVVGDGASQKEKLTPIGNGKIIPLN